jgi:succinoglycan biosynthesis protein ExoA
MCDLPAVDVVIPAKDAASTLPAAVASLRGQDYPSELVRVVVAVGPSTDGTEQVAEALPGVEVVENPSGATPAGLNLAIAAGSAPVVVRVDAHSVLPAGYIRAVVAGLMRPGVANVGGVQDPVAENGFSAAVAAAMRSPIGAGGAAYRSPDARPGPTDTVYLGAFRRDALAGVGGYDETLLRNQDYELNVRLRHAGWDVFLDPSLRVAYRPRSSARSLWRQYYDYGRFKRHVLMTHPGSLRARQVAAPALILWLVTVAVLTVVFDPLCALLVAPYVVVVGLAAARSDRACSTFQFAVAAVCMHLAWGVGFLTGRPVER